MGKFKNQQFSRQFWRKKYRSSRKGVFGGQIKPHKEVQKLHKNILNHEKLEAKKAEKELEAGFEELVNKEKKA